MSSKQHRLNVCLPDPIEMTWPSASNLKCQSHGTSQTSACRASTPSRVKGGSVPTFVTGRYNAFHLLAVHVLAFNSPISSHSSATGSKLGSIFFQNSRSSFGFFASAKHQSGEQRTHRGAKKWRRALSLLENLPRDDDVHIGAAMSVLNLPAKASLWEEPLLRLTQLCEADSRPQVGLFNAALSTSYWQRCLSLLHVMYQVDVRPNLLSFERAIEACGTGGQHQRALQLLGKMRRCDVDPQTSTYIQAAIACTKSHQWQSVLMLLKEMVDRKIPLHGKIFANAMTSCANAGHWQRCLSLLSFMQNVQLEPTASHYTKAMLACKLAAKPENIRQLFDEMQFCGVVPDVWAFNLAMEACLKLGMETQAEFLFQEMQDHRVQPRAFTYGIMMLTGDCEKSLSYLRDMRQKNIKATPFCYEAAMDACAGKPSIVSALEAEKRKLFST
mmetsp:Transcript_157740/g.294213  ORF Transcript_157740/g.294213 Transcript_157740/m.294213 type:complete len:443 (-) Transcript_157740:65-1393(-)